MAHVIAAPCIETKDTARVEVCLVACAHPRKDEPDYQGENKLHIDPETGTDCGAWVPVCPVAAIFAREELREKWAPFAKVETGWYANRKQRPRLGCRSSRAPSVRDNRGVADGGLPMGAPRARFERKPMPTTVTEYLSADHRRLDTIVLEAENWARSGALADAVAAFTRFSEGLDRHIQAEEEVLFPAFEEATGMLAGPTVVMRAEHAEMRGLLSDVSSALGAEDVPAALGAMQRLTGLLSDHNVKEETMLYPMTDRSARDLTELVDQVRSVIQTG